MSTAIAHIIYYYIVPFIRLIATDYASCYVWILIPYFTFYVLSVLLWTSILINGTWVLIYPTNCVTLGQGNLIQLLLTISGLTHPPFTGFGKKKVVCNTFFAQRVSTSTEALIHLNETHSRSSLTNWTHIALGTRCLELLLDWKRLDRSGDWNRVDP